MSSKQLYYGLIGVLVILTGLSAAVFIVGQQTLAKQSNKLVDLKLRNQLLEGQQAAVKKANKEIEKYADLEKVTQAIVPQDKDQAKAVREIIAIAALNGITIQKISFDASSLGTKSVTTTKPSTTDSPAAALSTPLQISQAKPVDGLPGVYSVQMSIEPVGGNTASYYNFLNFLTGLENNRRTAQVTSVSIQPRTSGSSIIGYDYKLSFNLFIKPGTSK